jgi:hypothetical protein
MTAFRRSLGPLGILMVSHLVVTLSGGCAGQQRLQPEARGPAAAPSNQELVQRLLDGSPWEGAFGYGDSGPSAGTLTMTFAVTGGSLKGEVTSITGRTTAQPGPVTQLEAKDGKVSFVTPSNGVHQELSLEGATLVGRWFGRTTGWLTLSPSRPQK